MDKFQYRQNISIKLPLSHYVVDTTAAVVRENSREINTAGGGGGGGITGK